MDESLRGRRVVITGGTGALGSAVVKAFADAGAVCEVTTRKEEASSRENVRYHVVDVGDESAVSHFYGSLANVWASVHLVGGFAMAPVEQTSVEQFRQMFE